jgi:hypothetical protein
VLVRDLNKLNFIQLDERLETCLPSPPVSVSQITLKEFKSDPNLICNFFHECKFQGSKNSIRIVYWRARLDGKQ